MTLVTLNCAPEMRILRQFGFIAAAAGILLGAFVWSGWAAGAAIALGAFSGLASLVRPAANRPLFVALSVATYPIGVAVSFLVLTLLFVGVITPVGLLLRVFGTDPLSRRLDRSARSYWVDAAPERPKEDYFRQY